MDERSPCLAKHRIAAALSPLLGTYVDPTSVHIWPARGYWTHNHQDVQRWTGMVEVEGFKYTIGSWNLTLANIRRGAKMECIDGRGEYLADNNFQFERDEGSKP